MTLDGSVTLIDEADAAGSDLNTHQFHVNYSAYVDGGGQVSSISSDQELVAFVVTNDTGDVVVDLGDSDAVQIDETSGVVQIDLTDVDDSNSPTLEAGDEIAFAVEPADNPAAGDYAVPVAITDASGETVLDNGTATLSIGEQTLAAIAGQNDPPDQVVFDDVLGAIGAFNDGEEIDGQAIAFEDVLDAISAFNEGSQV